MIARLPYVSRGVRAAAVIGVLLTGACTDDDITFRNREPFNAPVDAAAGFLGYFDVSQKQTTCGNCHADKQDAWRATAHAGAFGAPYSTGNEQRFCFPCHTVSERGNVVAAAAGWNALVDSLTPADSATAAVYQDVQCESCHGPGADHMATPRAVQPLASILADTGITNGCGECHEDTHHPFVEQWRESRHASPSSFAAGREGCNVCHEGKKALEVVFGVTSDYVEKDGDDLVAITCAVCHDPHGGPFEAQLRRDVGTASTKHICVMCHNRRASPPSSHGPHAAQGPLVLGEQVGWFPPNFSYAQGLASTHGSDDNPKLCATCHVGRFEVLDQNNEFLFQSVGHSFEAIPCVDAAGIPVPGPCTVDERNFSACEPCHRPAGDAKRSYQRIWARMNQLLDQIWFDSDDDHVIDPTDAGLLPKVVQQGDSTAIKVDDLKFTVAEGVLWNAQLAFTDDRPWFGDGEAFGVHFSAHQASANGVHNPFFLEALLLASIQALIDHYGVTPAPGVDLAPQLTPPPAAR